jgi:hypothetical protein
MTNHKYPFTDARGISPATSKTQVSAAPGCGKPLDAHGHDPDDYDWIAVPRRRRADGWTPEKQRAFIETLADSGSVVGAARAVGLSKQSAYALRRSKGAEGFAAAWDAAIGQASRLLADVAFDRALNGSEQHVIDKEGNHIYTHMKTNDRLLMFLLRAHQPHLYGRGAERIRSMDQAGRDGGCEVADAIEKLVPAVPENPEKMLDQGREQSEDDPSIELPDDGK